MSSDFIQFLRRPVPDTGQAFSAEPSAQRRTPDQVRGDGKGADPLRDWTVARAFSPASTAAAPRRLAPARFTRHKMRHDEPALLW